MRITYENKEKLVLEQPRKTNSFVSGLVFYTLLPLFFYFYYLLSLTNITIITILLAFLPFLFFILHLF